MGTLKGVLQSRNQGLEVRPGSHLSFPDSLWASRVFERRQPHCPPKDPEGRVFKSPENLLSPLAAATFLSCFSSRLKRDRGRCPSLLTERCGFYRFLDPGRAKCLLPKGSAWPPRRDHSCPCPQPGSILDRTCGTAATSFAPCTKKCVLFHLRI